jgi:hypothetical protein
MNQFPQTFLTKQLRPLPLQNSYCDHRNFDGVIINQALLCVPHEDLTYNALFF